MSQITTKFIANNAVTYAKFQQVAASSLIGNATGSTANVGAISIGATLVFSGSALQTGAGTGDVTWSANSFATSLVATSNSTLTTLSALTTASSLSSVGTITSGTWNATTIAIAHGGTGQTSAAAAYNALSPMTTTGDMEYESGTNTAARLPIGSTGQVLTVISGIPSWQTPATAPTLTSLGIRAGKQSISSASTSQAVIFSSTLGSTSYSVTAVLLNTTDTNPQFQPVTITVQSATGFTATWNAPTATANYVLSWQAILNN